MWIFEQLLGRGIEIALLEASDRDDRPGSDTTHTAATTAVRDER